jgi:hypothetical protein
LNSKLSDELESQVHHHLSLLDRLQRGGLRGHLAPVDARWSEFMSWVSENTGGHGGGQWLIRASRRAAQAADPALSAYTLMRQSQRALIAGDVRSAITLSKTSLSNGPLPSRTKVLCLSRLAEGLAHNGDDQAHDVVGSARRVLQAAKQADPDPLARHCDEQYVTAVGARCHQLLGDHGSAAAILGELLPAATYADQVDLGVWRVYLAESLAAKDPGRAAAHGLQAMGIAEASRSFRAVRAAQALAVTLRPHRRMPVVAQFVAAHAQLVAGNARIGGWS